MTANPPTTRHAAGRDANLVRKTCRTPVGHAQAPHFDIVAIATAHQQQALNLIQATKPLSETPTSNPSQVLDGNTPIRLETAELQARHRRRYGQRRIARGTQRLEGAGDANSCETSFRRCRPVAQGTCGRVGVASDQRDRHEQVLRRDGGDRAGDRPLR